MESFGFCKNGCAYSLFDSHVDCSGDHWSQGRHWTGVFVGICGLLMALSEQGILFLLRCRIFMNSCWNPQIQHVMLSSDTMSVCAGPN